MLLDNNNLRIAVQRKGRLASPSHQLMAAVGLDFEHWEGRLFAHCQSFPLDVLFLRDDDIPEYVQDGVADLGIVGLNVLEEKGANVVSLDKLGFGKCSLTIAVPRGSQINELSELQGKRVATSYPKILNRFLIERQIEVQVVEISGSVEITPSLGIADAICDLVSTGTTLLMNELRAIAVVLRSEAVLVANAKTLEATDKKDFIDRLRVRVQGTVQATNTRYVMMNAPKQSLTRIRDILPGMKSPTVVPLADEEMVAIHSAVPEDLFWDVIERLRDSGASDILVVPVEKII